MTLINHCKGIRITEKVGMLASLQHEYGFRTMPSWFPHTYHILSIAQKIVPEKENNGSKRKKLDGDNWRPLCLLEST